MARTKLVMVLALALAACLAACGDDEGGGGGERANAPAGGGAAAAAAKAADSKNKLVPRVHVEDRVSCPVPEKSTGPACEPMSAGSAAADSSKMLADCEPGLYCLPVGAAFSCESCPERDTIRHDFKDRDFVADQSRDPFFNFVILPSGVGDNTTNAKPEPHENCKRRDQFIATNYSYQDLKLVGIVAQGAQRKVLMIDSAAHGHIIRRGDCVGKEKAVVKDIGEGYVTFVVDEDPDAKRPAQEMSVQLHPNGLEVEVPPVELAPEPAAPIVAPPSTRAPQPPAASTPMPPSEPPVRVVPPPATRPTSK